MSDTESLTLPKAAGAADRRLGRIQAVVFDWDGTAVPDRTADAADLVGLSEKLAREGIWLAVVTGTNFDNIHRQFTSRVSPKGLSRVLLCTNRGSEVYAFDARGQSRVRWRRTATADEEARLTAIADAVKSELKHRAGIEIEVIYNRLNRRKIDLIPLAEWADPPKARIGELLVAVEDRLKQAGLERGLLDAIDLTRREAQAKGLPQARITSDVKHVEVGLTDKGDSVSWLRANLFAPREIAMSQVLIAGDEFGPIAGFSGSDDRMREEGEDALVVSVGREPNGVPRGVLHLQGGPPRFLQLLDDVLQARSTGSSSGGLADALQVRPASDWFLEDFDYEPPFEPELESRFAVVNGLMGLRGSLDLPADASQPRTYVAGLFDLSEAPPYVSTLVPAPNCLDLAVRVGGEPLSIEKGRVQEHRRLLDMRRGLMISDWTHLTDTGDTVRLYSLRLASLLERNIGLQFVSVQTSAPAALELEAGIAEPGGALEAWKIEDGLGVWVTRHSRQGLAATGSASLAASDARVTSLPGRSALHSKWSLEAGAGTLAELARVFSVARGPDPEAAAERARLSAGRLAAADAHSLYLSHVQAWEERWRLSDVAIQGDESAQRAMRFALYHLNSAANPQDEQVSVPARSLTGDAYMGHVFWDTEIYLLPFYTFTWPEAAKAMLMYRYHTLPGARTKAARLGYRGALYAWESAGTGEEETPSLAFGPGGEVMPVRSGNEEHHISADVAYAVWQYWRTTGDDLFMTEAGAEITFETSRFWASRARLEDDGYHIRHVIGPDEYHESIDDNAYTNEMARWNLERGIELAALLEQDWPDTWRELRSRLGLTDTEIDEWRDVATRLTSLFDPSTGLIEQFAGYFSLEDIDLRRFEPRTAPMDVILGPERTQRSQVTKQADVIMLMALLGDRFTREQRETNFRYYEPRCGHGSSLSPPVHSVMAARLGQMDMALRYFRQTAAIDLDDAMGNTFGGVHIGALGGLWQAVVLGFAGLGLAKDGISLDPRLPDGWEAIRFCVQWRGRTLSFVIEGPPLKLRVTLEQGEAMKVSLREDVLRLLPEQTVIWEFDDALDRWREVGHAD